MCVCVCVCVCVCALKVMEGGWGEVESGLTEVCYFESEVSG